MSYQPCGFDFTPLTPEEETKLRNEVLSIQTKARNDADAGNFRPNKYQKSWTDRMIYVLAYLGAREKMGLLGIAGEGK